MFDDLTDLDLDTLIADLRKAALNLAMGRATSDIRYGGDGQSFHPADAEKTEQFLNRAIEERNNRRNGCTRAGAIFPVGV